MKPIELLDEINKYCGGIIYSDFNEDNGHEWAGNFIDNLSCEIKVSSGISKLVLIPTNENYVLKIPFFGHYIETWKEYEDYPYSQDDPNYDWDEAGYYSAEFYPFEKAAVREGDADWDYCAAETSIYERAEEEGLECYFAAERLLGFIQETPVYVQDKVCPCEDSDIDMCRTLEGAEEETLKKFTSSYHKNLAFPEVWVSYFLSNYGEKEYIRLANFLEENNLDDWHHGNIAFIENDIKYPIPILLDYSNYNDQEKNIYYERPQCSMCTLYMSWAV